MRYALALTLEKIRAVWPTTLRSRFGWAFFASLVVVVGAVMVGAASAEVLDSVANGMINFVAWLMLAVANLAIGMCIFFLRFFIAIASYNNYIDVDVVQLGWVMVRDVANMFFVVALLVIAFGTILGLEEYEWKKNLVKLILAAIFINFSNLIAQLFIDVAHVFTMTFLNAISATAGGNLINMFKLDQITSMVGVNPDVNTEFNIEILAGTAVAALFAILAAVAMGSYVVVMMARVVALWALIILSPLAYILGVLPKTQSYAERWWSEFTNYVVVAPIMVFFLWLSFATLGAGNIMTSIQADIPEGNKLKENQSVELIGSNFVPKDDPTKISLSKVSTWENMANFLIALAFLRVGVKTTEETGVWGSEIISDAWSFGKKVATIATGVAAARWLGDRGGDGLKAVAGKAAWSAPLLGGRAMTNYGNFGKLQLGKAAYWRNEKAKELEKTEKDLRKNEKDFQMNKIDQATYLSNKANINKAAGGLAGRGLRLLGAALIQTGGRAEKKSQDWGKAVEDQKTFIEENYSTSDAAGGRAKLEWGILAHKAEEMAGAKKDQKYAEGEQYMLAQDEQRQKEEIAKLVAGGMSQAAAEKKAKAGKLQGLEATTMSAKAAAEAAHDELAGHSEIQQEAAREKYGVYGAKAGLERIKEEMKIGVDKKMETARRSVGLYDTRNRAEEEQMNLADEVAVARAAAYEKKGDRLRANAVMQAAQMERLKKDGELYGNMSYDERMGQEQALNAHIKEAITQGDLGLQEKLTRQKVALATFNSKKDPDSSRDSRGKALGSLGITDVDDSNRLQTELSRLVGKPVATIQEGVKLFKEMYKNNEEQVQAALASLLQSYKDAGAAGDAGGLGLISAKFDANKRKMVYDFNESGHTSPGNSAAFVRYMNANQITDITGLTGKYKVDANGNRTNTGVGARGQAMILELLKGKDSRAIASMKESFFESWDDTQNMGEFKGILQQLKTNLKKEAFEALMLRLPKIKNGLNP